MTDPVLYPPIIEEILARLEAIEARLEKLDEHQHQQYAPASFQGVPFNTTRPIGFASRGSKL